MGIFTESVEKVFEKLAILPAFRLSLLQNSVFHIVTKLFCIDVIFL